MRRLIMSRLIWIYAVCKSLLLSPVAVKELLYLKTVFSGSVTEFKDGMQRGARRYMVVKLC